MQGYQPTPEDLQRIMQLLHVGGPYRQGDATDQAIWAQRAQQAGPQQPTIFDLMGALQLALGAAGAAPGMGGQVPSIQGLKMAPRPSQGPSGGPPQAMPPAAAMGPQATPSPMSYRAQLEQQIAQQLAALQQVINRFPQPSGGRLQSPMQMALPGMGGDPMQQLVQQVRMVQQAAQGPARPFPQPTAAYNPQQPGLPFDRAPQQRSTTVARRVETSPGSPMDARRMVNQVAGEWVGTEGDRVYFAEPELGIPLSLPLRNLTPEAIHATLNQARVSAGLRPTPLPEMTSDAVPWSAGALPPVPPPALSR